MAIIFTLCFILLDIVTGLFKALKNGEYNSSKMRSGLWAKAGSIALIILGVIGEYAMRYMDLGIIVPLNTAICTYVSLMEIGSIIENIGGINENYVPSNIRKFFSKLNTEKEDEEK